MPFTRTIACICDVDYIYMIMINGAIMISRSGRYIYIYIVGGNMFVVLLVMAMVVNFLQESKTQPHS